MKINPKISVPYWAILLMNACSLCECYKNIILKDYLCADKFLLDIQRSLHVHPAFTLTEDRDSAAIITQMWNTTLPGYYSSNKLKYDCYFRVQTPHRPPRGIYTVITRLKFRRDPVNNACIDYIQFVGGNRPASEKICNEIAIDGPGRLIFDERNREVNIHIYIDKRVSIKEPLELRMVMTAHSECKYTGDFLCDPKDQYSCISRHFVRDNITNCMYPCRDEISCFHDVPTSVEADTTYVALSALTSLIFTMLGVGFCIWVCWKYWNCITVQQHAHEASAAAHRRGQTETPVVQIPNAPSFSGAITSSIGYEQDNRHHQPQSPKDLPPSYESLFPER
ncbi:uncharacterized protein LOC126755101 [Bactrocera neohumeralis]|uniref:uncharacterized protein LOC126755101 n=1 Tax=Bactrocera neohumeralis TaxID=98809 RepID=UPI0021663F15|nr:uncharacterized protein LOC126755101 [Bactrocera neohumeralis]